MSLKRRGGKAPELPSGGSGVGRTRKQKTSPLLELRYQNHRNLPPTLTSVCPPSEEVGSQQFESSTDGFAEPRLSLLDSLGQWFLTRSDFVPQDI